MRHQIVRLSPHQNGKVFGALMAIISAILLVPLLLVAILSAPKINHTVFIIVIVLPIAYFIIGYIFSALGCTIYNLIFKHTGGFEFEIRKLD